MSSTIDNTLDMILSEVGDFGMYQKFIFGLIAIAVILHSGVHVAFVFTALDLEYRCEIPGCDTDSPEYEPSWLKNAVPYKNNVPSKCKKYVLNKTENFQNCTEPTDFTRSETEQCNSFVYKTEEKSILQEYDLHCPEKLWMLTTVGSVNNGGQFCGLLIAGVVSDMWGRRMVVIMTIVLCGICGLFRTLAPTYTWILVLEFLDALFGSGTYPVAFIIGVELVGPKKRVLTSTLISACFTFGCMLAAATAWIFKDWRIIIYILYGPPMLLFVYFWIIPESIRWQLSKGKVEKAKQTLLKAARVNKTTIDQSLLDRLATTDDEKEKTLFHKIFKIKILFLRLINCIFCYITCVFIYYGITLNAVSLVAGNPYLDFMLTCLIEIPSYVTCIYVVEKLGRRWSLLISFIITGISCFVYIFIPNTSEFYYANLTAWLTGKFGATAAFILIYIVTSELFPTPMRHTAVGVCATIGRVGSIAAPQVPLMAKVWKPLPILLFSAMSFTAAFLTFLFPETHGIKLPDNLEEAIQLGKIQPQ